MTCQALLVRDEVTLITGAGRGLGLALAREAARRGARVIATWRDAERARELFELAAREPAIQIERLDVAGADSIASLAGALSGRIERVDVLIHNAGVNSTSADIATPASVAELGHLEAEALTLMWRTNALGPLLLTQALAPMLLRSARPRVVAVGSRRGSLQDKDRPGNHGYCMSKAALNMAVRALAQDLGPRVVVSSVHPGALRTAMAQPDATLSAAEGAVAFLDLVERLHEAHSGAFLRTDGSPHPW